MKTEVTIDRVKALRDRAAQRQIDMGSGGVETFVSCRHIVVSRAELITLCDLAIKGLQAK